MPILHDQIVELTPEVLRELYNERQEQVRQSLQTDDYQSIEDLALEMKYLRELQVIADSVTDYASWRAAFDLKYSILHRLNSNEILKNFYRQRKLGRNLTAEDSREIIRQHLKRAFRAALAMIQRPL